MITRTDQITLGLAALVFMVQGVTAQMLPSHGAAAAGSAPVLVQRAPAIGSGDVFYHDIGIDLIYGPSPKDKRFDDILGFGLSATFPLQSYLALRTGVGFERYQGNGANDDANVIPLGLSFLVGFPGALRIPVALEAGLRYQFVDFADEDGDYDNALGAVIGLSVASSATSGVSYGVGLSYGLDISKSKNDAGETLPLEAFLIKLSFRFTY